MNYYIITGASRGLGYAIAKGLIQPGNQIYCIARTNNEELAQLARERGVRLEFVVFDLFEVHNIEEMMSRIFARIDKKSAESIVLINNAGLLAPIKPIELCSSKEIARSITVNLTAPMVMTSSFIANTQDVQAEKRIINISSGAGKKPYSGWSSYCSAKAGLDLFTRCVAVEQADKAYPVKVISFAPGVVDTQMQAEIRMTEREYFAEVERFVQYKDEGKLLDPEAVADVVIRLSKAEVNNGDVLDIRDMKGV